MHRRIHRLECREFHWSGADTEDRLVGVDGFDMAIGDGKSSDAFQTGHYAGNAFWFEGLDQACGRIGERMGFCGLIFHGFIVGTEPPADFV